MSLAGVESVIWWSVDEHFLSNKIQTRYSSNSFILNLVRYSIPEDSNPSEQDIFFKSDECCALVNDAVKCMRYERFFFLWVFQNLSCWNFFFCLLYVMKSDDCGWKLYVFLFHELNDSDYHWKNLFESKITMRYVQTVYLLKKWETAKSHRTKQK